MARTRPWGGSPLVAGPSSGGERRAPATPPPYTSAAEADDRADAELVTWAREDHQAFVHLYRRYARRVYRFCFSLLGERDAAEDATSATFLKAFERFGTLQDGAGFESWLFRIAHNVVNDDYRSRRPVAPLDEAAWVEGVGASLEDLAIAGEDHALLWRLLGQLKPDERELIALRLNGLNDKQIAAVLRRSHGTVRNKQSKIMGRLRAFLHIATGEEAPRAER